MEYYGFAIFTYLQKIQYECWLLESLLLLVLRLGLALRALVAGLLFVDLLEDVEGLVLDLVGLFLEFLHGDFFARLGTGDELSKGGELLLEGIDVLLVELLLVLVQGVVDLVADGVTLVSSLDSVTTGLVLFLVLLSVADHLLDLRVGETRGAGNGDGGVLVGTLVTGRDVDDTIGINVEGDLDLWHTLWSWWDVAESEVTNQLVVSDELTLTLVNSDLDRGLASGSGGEDLGLTGWDGSVSVDQTSEDTAEGLDTQGKWVTSKRRTS